MSNKEKKGWKELPIGGLILNSGNASDYKTGTWRVKKPVYIEERCIQCFLCWIYCPDMAINVENGEVKGVDYYHCKGCGICARQCPTTALEMINEDENYEKEG